MRVTDELGSGVYRLRKALYGLKQAARAWRAKLLGELVRMGFTASEADPCMFYVGEGQEDVYVLIYMDDGVIIGKRHTFEAALAAIAGAFDIKDVGEVTYFPGLQLLTDCEQDTNEMKVDILTKALPGPSHEDGARGMGMHNVLQPRA